MQQDLLLGIVAALFVALPLAWKWQLGLRTVAAFVVTLALLCSVLVWLLTKNAHIAGLPRVALIWVVTLLFAASFLLYRFYRDPERTPPARDDVVVSPADGEVIYVRESRDGLVPLSVKEGNEYPLTELTKTSLQTQDARVVGIGMNFADVHVNRAPIKGKVVFQKHFSGEFGSLRRPEMVLRNERATTVIEREGLQVAVVQIASRLVRRIAVFVREGEHVALGQRIGVIRFGSQVDVVLPAQENLRVTVREGERVKAGESIIAMLTREEATAVSDPKPT